MSTFGDSGTFGGSTLAGFRSPILPILRSFNQQATIYTRTAGAVDDYNNPTSVFTVAGVWPCLKWSGSGRENRSDRDTQVDVTKVDLPPDAIIDGHSQVEIDGIMYQVVGPPELLRTPSGPHHYVATLTVAT